MKNIIFVAPPAAGKGSISNLLKSRNGYNHISTGDLLREVLDGNNEILANKVKTLLASGSLVSDELVFELLKNKLKNGFEPFILDGYPRNIIQAEMLDNLFNKLGINNYKVIFLNINEELAMKRSLSRLICPRCEKSYNTLIQGAMPKNGLLCDNCLIPLIKRNDDNEETFKKRYELFKNSTLPVVDYYKHKNEVSIIDCSKTIEEIYNDTLKVVL